MRRPAQHPNLRIGRLHRLVGRLDQRRIDRGPAREIRRAHRAGGEGVAVHFVAHLDRGDGGEILRHSGREPGKGLDPLGGVGRDAALKRGMPVVHDDRHRHPARREQGRIAVADRGIGDLTARFDVFPVKLVAQIVDAEPVGGVQHPPVPGLSKTRRGPQSRPDVFLRPEGQGGQRGSQNGEDQLHAKSLPHAAMPRQAPFTERAVSCRKTADRNGPARPCNSSPPP